MNAFSDMSVMALVNAFVIGFVYGFFLMKVAKL